MPSAAEAPWGWLEQLRPAQIEAVKRTHPVAYVPFGALEWHGPHCPVGLDGLKAHALLGRLARVCGGLVLPPFYIGTETIKPYKGFPHTLDHSSRVVSLVAGEVLDQLADEGFRAIVLLTGHYSGGQQEAIRRAAEAFGERCPGVGLWAGGDNVALHGRYPDNHAALGETSLQLAFQPRTVDLSLLPAGRAATLDDDGVLGDDPRQATAEQGERIVEAFLDFMVPRVRDLMAAARADRAIGAPP